MYATITKLLSRFVKKHTLFKYGFNVSPMYRRSTGRVYYCSADLLLVKIVIPLSYKNRNYVGSIFGGSLSSATDPINMIQLMHILGNDYVVWDKASTIKFRRPAKESAFAEFSFSEGEIDQIKETVGVCNEMDLIKEIKITNKEQSVVFAELSKTIYIASKEYYKSKRKNANRVTPSL